MSTTIIETLTFITIKLVLILGWSVVNCYSINLDLEDLKQSKFDENLFFFSFLNGETESLTPFIKSPLRTSVQRVKTTLVANIIS